jgi:uncharacterized protein (DUF302 family)
MLHRYRTKTVPVFPDENPGRHLLRTDAQEDAAMKIMPLTLLALTASIATAHADDGVIKARSAYPITETIERIKQDVASKGISFFAAIDQSQVAASAGIELQPSTLLIFGNPALGAQFITSNPVAGLDWPVRLLVFQEADGGVWAAYTDFEWIAHRHHISDRQAAFSKATEVIGSITASIRMSAPR